MTGVVLKIARRIWEVGVPGWPSTGGVLNMTAAACTARFQWWRSGDITRTQNVSEYMLVLAVCLVFNGTDFATQLSWLRLKCIERI